jgi:NADH-quinone oxidoreductase subunit K
MINLQYITLGFILFIIATFGIIINRKNLIVLLMCIELALLSINFILIISSSYLDNIVGELFAFYILVVAAAESAIGLSILVSYYRIKGTISVKFINLLRG